jgi:nicotinamidase-related amidase
MPMHALLVVDAQNEFSPRGQRAVSNHANALGAIREWVGMARERNWPIAWVQHFNRPNESLAFVPGTWGAELSDGFGPREGVVIERLFQKDVYGAFTTTDLHAWLGALGVTHVAVVGFFAHMCLSTTVREALVRGYEVSVDPSATGACALHDVRLGEQSAEQVVQSALLHLLNMGATLALPRAGLRAVHPGPGGGRSRVR